jgi:dipeptidyl aminopeptidase/acylaminoacyl peptidase
MKAIRLIVVAVLVVVGCGKSPPAGTGSLADARRGFATKARPSGGDRAPADVPPPGVFSLVRYDSPVGKLAAYLTPDPMDGKKRPAIVWITGGDCNSIGDCWSESPPDNDQSASAFRKGGIAMMVPALRGGNDNPGTKEGFFGEVDDVLAAADFLSKQPFVDPARIYLGGHSTGGTLVLLVAECSDRFRGVFSFGPADELAGYPAVYTPFDTSDAKEVALRSPGRWLHSVRSPVFVLEGTTQGNLGALQNMARASKNTNLHFLPVKGATHFSILAPTTRLLADKIVRDTGPTTNIAVAEAEVNRLFGK